LTYVAPSPVHGRGVFALQAIRLGQVIERCPCIVLETGWQQIQTVLHDYLYCWPREGDGRAVVLGHGSLFNHDTRPNADWTTDNQEHQFTYHAIRDIHPHEEIFIDYGQDYWAHQHANAPDTQRIALDQLLSHYRTRQFD
jgi:SET domain-containing protein